MTILRKAQREAQRELHVQITRKQLGIEELRDLLERQELKRRTDELDRREDERKRKRESVDAAGQEAASSGEDNAVDWRMSKSITGKTDSNSSSDSSSDSSGDSDSSWSSSSDSSSDSSEGSNSQVNYVRCEVAQPE